MFQTEIHVLIGGKGALVTPRRLELLARHGVRPNPLTDLARPRFSSGFGKGFGEATALASASYVVKSILVILRDPSDQAFSHFDTVSVPDRILYEASTWHCNGRAHWQGVSTFKPPIRIPSTKKSPARRVLCFIQLVLFVD